MNKSPSCCEYGAIPPRLPRPKSTAIARRAMRMLLTNDDGVNASVFGNPSVVQITTPPLGTLQASEERTAVEFPLGAIPAGSEPRQFVMAVVPGRITSAPLGSSWGTFGDFTSPIEDESRVSSAISGSFFPFETCDGEINENGNPSGTSFVSPA